MRGGDPRLVEAKAIPITEVIDRLGIAGLRRTGCELVGPCPLCGGRDRFGVNLRSNAFLCRKCDIRGGDQIALVRQVLGLSFREALSWLCGEAATPKDRRALEHRLRRAERARRRQEAWTERERARARREAAAIWRRARPASGTLVEDYLALRGIRFRGAAFPRALRYIPDHPYVRAIEGQRVLLHRGPAMVAVIQQQDGKGGAVHQTWIDTSRPSGKAEIVGGGRRWPAKLVRGSKKGGAIRLVTPAGATTLVMGEGIETTLSAMIAQAVPGAAYWAGVDLGNMAGRMVPVAGRRWSGIPDMSDMHAWVPPPWVRRLIFVMDGDSDPVMTRAKLECGLRRAMAARPGLVAQIVRAGEGCDLNDVLRGAA